MEIIGNSQDVSEEEEAGYLLVFDRLEV